MKIIALLLYMSAHLAITLTGCSSAGNDVDDVHTEVTATVHNEITVEFPTTNLTLPPELRGNIAFYYKGKQADLK